MTARLPYPAPRWVALAAAVTLGQAAITGAFSRFGSEVASHRAGEAVDRGDFTAARRDADAAASLDPTNGYALFRAASAEFVAVTASPRDARTSGALAAATASLRHALPWIPHRPNVLRLLGQADMLAHDYAGGAEKLGQVLRLNPEPVTAPEILHLFQATALFGAGRYGEAAAQFTRAGRYPANRLELFAPRLVTALILNQPLAAEGMVRALAHEAPGRNLSDGQLAGLFEAARARGKYDALIRTLESSLKAQGLDPRFVKRLAAVYSGTGRADEGLALLARLRVQEPADPEIPLMRGDIEFVRGNSLAARGAYAEHLRMDPKSPFRGDIVAKVGIDP